MPKTKSKPVSWANKVVGYDVLPPDQLLANPANFRRHPAKQREALRGSLNELGVIAPVLVNRLTGHLLDGHARVEEYLSAGIEAVPVAYVEVLPEKEGLALLSLDPIAAQAEADKEALDALLRDVATSEEGLQALFAELAEDAGLYFEGAGGGSSEDPGAQIDKAEELRKKWQTERGQIWQVGVHRIACGDCRDACCLEALMQGRRAQMLWTDPPYGVSYVGKTKDALTIQNDAPGDLAEVVGGGPWSHERRA